MIYALNMDFFALDFICHNILAVSYTHLTLPTS